jgi:hypothetical protein
MDVSDPKLIDGLLLRGVGHTNTNAQLDISTVIQEIRVLQDSEEKVLIKPALQRKLDDFLNANGDTLKIDYIYLPFNRFLNPKTGWGTRNIGKLLIKVKQVAAYPANTAFTALKAIVGYHPITSPVPRGDVYVQTVFPQAAPVAGWNQINDFQYYQITHLTKLLFDNPAITEVEIYKANSIVYQMKKADQLFVLNENPLYKVPASCTHVEIDGALSASTGPFPAILDDMGESGDALNLFSKGVRQLIKIRYFWDTNVNAVAAFDILAEGFERDLKAKGVAAAAVA